MSGSDRQDGRGAALGWRHWQESDGPLIPSQLLDLARTLRDAESAGAVHGHLSPRRLLIRGERLQVEGYGEHWSRGSEFTAPEGPGTIAADVWSMAATVRAVETTIEDSTISAVLELCTSHDASERPSAEELYLALKRLLPPEADKADRETEEVERESRAAGATTGAADADSVGDDGRRRLLMLGVLMGSVVILALLAVFGPRSNRTPLTAVGEASVYVVEVFVAPDDLPPVTIHLISSPPGSELSRGERLGTAPRHLALDRAGTWSFQGSLGERRSEVVAIEVPEERSLTLEIP